MFDTAILTSQIGQTLEIKNFVATPIISSTTLMNSTINFVALTNITASTNDYIAHVDLGPELETYDSWFNFFDNLLSSNLINSKMFSLNFFNNSIEFGENLQI